MRVLRGHVLEPKRLEPKGYGFGGPKIRARIALPCGAVRPNTCDHRRRWRGIDADIDDSITLLAPQWGSAVHFGDQRFAPESRSRAELSAQTRATIDAVGAV